MSGITRLALLVIVAALTGCSTLVRTPDAQPAAGAPQDAWARVLERYVDEQGRVDFESVAKNRADLDRYVEWIYAVGPNNQPQAFPTRPDVLAYHLNAYNALAMYNVIESGIPESLAGLRKVPFFFLRKLKVGGEPITLYAYENEVIRKLGEERVHFALNCMSVGCPRLPRTPFHAESLDAELDREARLFFNEERNVQVDASMREVRLSEILKFYTSDFLVKAPSLIAYVNRYRHASIPLDYRVGFIPYDWTINRQPAR